MQGSVLRPSPDTHTLPQIRGPRLLRTLKEGPGICPLLPSASPALPRPAVGVYSQEGWGLLPALPALKGLFVPQCQDPGTDQPRGWGMVPAQEGS